LPGGPDLPNHGAWSDRLQHSGVAEVVGREKTPQLGIGALTANAPAEMASGYIQQNTNKLRSEKMSISNRPLERSIYGSTIFIVPEQSRVPDNGISTTCKLADLAFFPPVFALAWR
jgi:hypothetical protein